MYIFWRERTFAELYNVRRRTQCCCRCWRYKFSVANFQKIKIVIFTLMSKRGCKYVSSKFWLNVSNSWQHWHAVSRIASCSSSSMLRQWGAPNGGAGQHLRSCSAAAVAGRPARSTYQTSPHITPLETQELPAVCTKLRRLVYTLRVVVHRSHAYSMLPGSTLASSPTTWQLLGKLL